MSNAVNWVYVYFAPLVQCALPSESLRCIRTYMLKEKQHNTAAQQYEIRKIVLEIPMFWKYLLPWRNHRKFLEILMSLCEVKKNGTEGFVDFVLQFLMSLNIIEYCSLYSFE